MDNCERIESEELFNRFAKLKDAINVCIRDLNYGGCAVVAGIVGDVLQDLGIICDIATPTYGKPAVEVRPNVGPKATANTWYHNGLSTHHLAVRFRVDGITYIWDSDCLCVGGLRFGGTSGDRLEAAGQLGDGLTVKECIHIGSKATGWNSTFDRQQIPLLKTLVEYHLKFGL